MSTLPLPLHLDSRPADSSWPFADVDTSADGVFAALGDRSQRASPCPSLVYSTGTGADSDSEEDRIPNRSLLDLTKLVREYKGYEGGAMSSTSTRQQPIRKRPRDEATADGMANANCHDDGDDDEYSDRDEKSSPRSPSSPKKRKSRNESLRFACPYRKQDPLRFNIREYHACSMNSFGDIAKLKFAYPSF